MNVKIGFSKVGMVAAALFVLAAAIAFGWVFFIASKNPADSGESGIVLLLFLAPWVFWLPAQLLNMATAVALFIFNAALVYMVFGGLRIRRKDR